MLKRNTCNQKVEYRIKSTVRAKQERACVMSYRNLVLDVVTDPDAGNEDLPGGNDDEAEQSFRIKAG